MAARHLGAAFITNPVSIAYVTGFHANPHERLMALAVGSRDATLVVPAIEQEKATQRAPGTKVVAWRDGEDAYALVTAATRYEAASGLLDVQGGDPAERGWLRLLAASLRRFQDEVNEVRAGMECGIRIEGFSDYQIGDAIECYTLEKVPQKL